MSDPFAEEAIRRVLARRQGNAPGVCPDANELAAYLEARLSASEAARFEEHAADCAACRQTLALSLQLAEREETAATETAHRPRAFSYRTSLLRLALGAALALTVGVLLFQSTREPLGPLQKPIIAEQNDRSDVSGGAAATLSSPEGKGTSAQAPEQVAGIQPSQSQQRRAVPGSSMPSTIPAAALKEGSAGRQADVKAEAAKSVPTLLAEELRKTRQAQIDAEALKAKSATVRPEEPKIAADRIVSLPKGAVTSQAAGEVTQAQIANVQTQAVSNQAQTIGNQAQNLANQAQSAGNQAQNWGQAMGGMGGGGAAQARAQAVPLQNQIVPVKGVDRVQEALAEARLVLAQRMLSDRNKEATAGTTKKVGDRDFYRTKNYWVDSKSNLDQEAPSREITRDSKEYADILKKEPALAELSGGVPIVLYFNGINYLVR